tara:strand:- start:201 stop:374 length:174 start_codon:yes stop_codon:yes gene_type:complete
VVRASQLVPKIDDFKNEWKLPLKKGNIESLVVLLSSARGVRFHHHPEDGDRKIIFFR